MKIKTTLFKSFIFLNALEKIEPKGINDLQGLLIQDYFGEKKYRITEKLELYKNKGKNEISLSFSRPEASAISLYLSTTDFGDQETNFCLYEIAGKLNKKLVDSLMNSFSNINEIESNNSFKKIR